MKKNLLIAFAALFVLKLEGQITTPYLYHTNDNNWSGSGISEVAYRGTLGVKSHRLQFQASFTGDNFYKINNQSNNNDNDFNQPSGSKVWSGGLTVGALGTAFAYGDGGGGAGSFSVTSGKYYTFIWRDVNTATNADAFVMETDNAPVGISNVFFSPANPSTTQTVGVSVDLTGTPSSQEKVFVRYSTNGFSSGYGTLLSPTSGNGTNAQTFTIPAQAHNTTVTFYAFTTTLSSSSLSGNATLTDLATISFDNNGGSNYSYTSLPIELTRFDAQVVGKSVLLNWQTATEVNNSHFEVEHSLNAQSWKKLADVAGHGTSLTPNSYTWTHNNTSAGVNYYRLRQVDWDGTSAYSPVARAVIGRSTGVVVAPNPLVGNILQVKLDNDTEENLRVQLFNTQGVEVKTFSVESTVGQWHSLDVSDLPSGVYWLVANNGTPVKVVR